MISDMMSHLEDFHHALPSIFRHACGHDIENSSILMIVQCLGYIYHVFARSVIDGKQHIVFHVFHDCFLFWHIICAGSCIRIRIIRELRSS